MWIYMVGRWNRFLMQFCKKHKQEYMNHLLECPICYGEQMGKIAFEYARKVTNRCIKRFSSKKYKRKSKRLKRESKKLNR